MKVENGKQVKVDYVGKLNDGEVFDSSEGREPIEFTVGENQVIKGFDEGIVGMEVGEEKTLSIGVEDGYGEYDDKLVYRVPLGETINVQTPVGPMPVKILGLDKDEENNDVLLLDGNHPLAGKELTFEVKVVEVNETEKTESQN